VNYEDEDVVLLLENIGLTPETYLVDLEADNWVTKQFDTLYLEPGRPEEYKLFLDTREVPEGVYTAKLTLTAENGVGYEYELTINLKERPFIVKAWQFFTQTPCKTLIPILLMLIALTIVAFGFYYVGPNKALAVIGLVALAGAVIFTEFVIFYGIGAPTSFYGDLSYKSDGLSYEWPEDHPLQITLTDLFVDADQDALTFIATRPEHVDVTISNNTAILVPEKDWFGETSIVFSASDGEEVTSSPEISLKVRNIREVRLADYINLYCWYITLVLFLLLITMGLFTQWARKQKRKKEELARIREQRRIEREEKRLQAKIRREAQRMLREQKKASAKKKKTRRKKTGPVYYY
jgi:hypothetical protein